jgi:hypothetical protein
MLKLLAMDRVGEEDRVGVLEWDRDMAGEEADRE